jgi:hypothetical protein
MGSVEDPSLSILAQSQFRALQAPMHSAIELLTGKPELASLLNPNNALQKMSLELLAGQQDWETSASLLTLEAMDEVQRKNLIHQYGAQIDLRLRGINGPLSDKDRVTFANHFKMLSMAVLSVTPPELGTDVRRRAAEVGALLMSVLGDATLTEQQRREKGANIRAAIRPLLKFGQDLNSFDLLRGFLNKLLDTQDPKTYEACFTIKPPDLSMQLSKLRELESIFRAIEYAVPAA